MDSKAISTFPALFPCFRSTFCGGSRNDFGPRGSLMLTARCPALLPSPRGKWKQVRCRAIYSLRLWPVPGETARSYSLGHDRGHLRERAEMALQALPIIAHAFIGWALGNRAPPS